MHKFIFLLVLVHTALAIDDHLLTSHPLGSQRSVNDRAIGFATKGGIENASINSGVLSHYYLEPSGADENYQYVTGLSFFLGLPGRDETGTNYPWALRSHPDFPDTSLYFGPTVSESWFDRSIGLVQTDWEAVDNSYGELFSGELRAGDAFSDFWTQAEDPRRLLAHSDLTASWPNNGDGSYWPGIDGSGDFTGERDIYFEFTDDPYANRDEDQTQGYPTQVKVLTTLSDFDNPVYEDAILIRMQLVNESEWDYENVFSGFYFDVDSYSRLRNGRYTGRTNDDDMMAMDLESNSTFIWDYDGNSNGATDLQHVGLQFIETPVAPYSMDFDDDGLTDVNQGEMLGLSSWRWFNWYTRPGVLQDEAWGASCPDGYAGASGCPGSIDKEAIQYALISGDVDYPNEVFTGWEWRGQPSGTTNIRASHYEEWYFQPDSTGETHSHFDGSAALGLEENSGRDCLLMAATGPFNFPAGDTLNFIAALVLGKKDVQNSMNIPQDLKGNMERLQAFVDANYYSPQVEIINPQMHSEHMHDVSVGWSYEGLEGVVQDEWGIRFRGESGVWDDWRFADSSVPGVTVAVNDLPDYPWYSIQVMAGSNSLFGFDQIDSIIINNPGNSPGFGHFVSPAENELVSGEYNIHWELVDLEGDELSIDLYCFPEEYPGWVLIEAGLANTPYVWDTSRFPNSSAMQLRMDVSDGELERTYYSSLFRTENQLPVLPGSLISHTHGNSNASIIPLIVDANELTGHDYSIEYYALPFNSSEWGHTRMRIVDETENDTLYTYDQLFNFMETPYFHGLRLRFLSWPNVEVDTIEWIRGSPSFDIQPVNFCDPGIPGQYLMTFSEMGVDTALISPVAVPFQIFNALDGSEEPVDVAVMEWLNDRRWQVGEPIFLYEENYPRLIDSTRKSLCWRFDTSPDPDTLQLWQPGDSILISMNIPFQRGDRYEFTTDISATDGSIIQPEKMALLPCFPNPFNASVTIPFYSPQDSKISLVIYDLKGRVVWESGSSETIYGAGENSIVWRGLNSRGKSVASGVYVIGMQAEGFTAARKVLLLK